MSNIYTPLKPSLSSDPAPALFSHPPMILADYQQVFPIRCGAAAKAELRIPKGALLNYDGRYPDAKSLSSAVVVVKYALTRENNAEIANEIEVLQLLNTWDHCHMVETVNFAFDVPQMWVATGVLTGGTVGEMLAAPDQAFSETLVWHILKQLMDAVAFLHGYVDAYGQEIEYGGIYTGRMIIAHHDIHMGNVMFDLSGKREFAALPNIRLIDFGRASAMEITRNREGSPKFGKFKGVQLLRMLGEEDLDVMYIGALVHEIVHTTYQGLNFCGDSCEACHACGSDETKDCYTLFGPLDADFQTVREIMEGPGADGRRKFLTYGDYTTINSTAEWRRMRAFSREGPEEQPLFSSCVGAIERRLEEAMSKAFRECKTHGNIDGALLERFQNVWNKPMELFEDENMLNEGSGDSEMSGLTLSEGDEDTMMEE